MTATEIQDRLEYLRGEHIEPGDVELLEAAGVPEEEAERMRIEQNMADGIGTMDDIRRLQDLNANP